jgi:hypothetical protein
MKTEENFGGRKQRLLWCAPGDITAFLLFSGKTIPVQVVLELMAA